MKVWELAEIIESAMNEGRDNDRVLFVQSGNLTYAYDIEEAWGADCNEMVRTFYGSDLKENFIVLSEGGQLGMYGNVGDWGD